MKTVSANRSRGSFIRAIGVVGGLLALYFYRRRGGSVSNLVRSGVATGKSSLDSARSYLRKTAPESGSEEITYGGVTGRSPGSNTEEIYRSPDEMDRYPTT